MHDMQSDVFSFADLLSDPDFDIKMYPDKSVYKGTLQRESGRTIRSGKGVMLYSTGRLYEGGWKHDRRDSLGFERYANGNSYKGGFKQGKAHGAGCYKWQNGEEYSGNWSLGQKEGFGMW